MLREIWRRLGRAGLCSAALLSVANLVSGQTLPAPAPAPLPGAAVPPAATSPASDDLKTRLDRLEKQNLELTEALRALQGRQAVPTSAPAPVAVEQGPTLNKEDVQKIVGDYVSDQAAKAKAAEAAKKAEQDALGFTVGKSTAFAGVWTNHQPWFETADKAFRIHIGGRIQPDWVFGANVDDNVARGTGGTGQFNEGFNMRRARLEADGWVHEVIDFFIEYDFANQFSSGQPFTVGPGGAVNAGPNSDANTFGVPAPTDVWASINYIPWLGGIRIGNFKPPIGLEHLISSRYLDFMERWSGFDVYYNRNNGFEPGFMLFNHTENQRLTWQLSATKPTNTLFAWTTGGGEWAYTARVTGLPIYEANGRRMVHLGLGARYIDNLDQGFANLTNRWLLRQGGGNLQNVVARAQVFGESQSILNPELFINMGPLSIQAEYISCWVNNVTRFSTPLVTNAPISSRTYFNQAAYVQALYFLTGEHRPYGKTAVHASGAAPTRVVPHRNYFWVPGESGNPFSCGAWQVGVRYSWTDLNDSGINGGIVNEVTLGLNWFLNPNMKIQWNYDIGHRGQIGGTSDGNYSGFGMRMAFDF